MNDRMRRTCWLTIAVAWAGLAALAAAPLRLETKNLAFEIGADGAGARFDMPKNTVANGDVWRLILDDGLRTEIPVFSHAQKGRVTLDGNRMTLAYDTLVSDFGDVYDISFRLGIEKRGEILYFTPTIENRSSVRVNECFAPLVPFDGIAGDKKTDALYLPRGLGNRTVNPYAGQESIAGAYYDHNERETSVVLPYPRASMCWMGVESGGKFLYLSRQDPEIRECFLVVRHTIRTGDLMLAIAHLPMARAGETLAFAPTAVALFDGDWRTGAQEYRAWADGAFFKVTPKADWVKRLTGWQRIVMRLQTGEDTYKFEDLPKMYETGHRYGIDTLFLFAYWKEGMDRAYPKYEEPYPGAWKTLKENIAQVRARGGRVIIECNVHMIDPKSDFYRQFGEEVRLLDINGNEHRVAFSYPGYGTLRHLFGKAQFAVACSGSARWRKQLFSQLEMMQNAFDPDCLFYDCYGAAPTQPCFNARHDHGPRIDVEWKTRRMAFADAEAYCAGRNKVLACEIPTDIAASYVQFNHGLSEVDLAPGSNQFPALFRYTFPEIITTNRGCRSSDQKDYEAMLKSCLVYGLRFDAELYVCRRTLDADPKYAAVIGWCTAKMKEYGEFYFDGRFTARDVSPLPTGVRRGEFLNADGTQVLTVFLNTGHKPVKIGTNKLAAGEMVFTVKEVN